MGKALYSGPASPETVAVAESINVGIRGHGQSGPAPGRLHFLPGLDEEAMLALLERGELSHPTMLPGPPGSP